MTRSSFAYPLVAVLALAACTGDGPLEAGGSVDDTGVRSPVGDLTLSTGGRIVATYTANRHAPSLYQFGLDGATPEPLLLDAPSDWIELRATASPTNGRIVFQAGWPETRLTTAEDPEVSLVEAGPAHQIWPQFTADGDSVVFAGGDGPGMTTTIWVAHAAGGHARPLWTSTSELISPSLSPSRERLAVVSWHELLVVDLATGHVIGSVPGANVAKYSPTEDRLALLIDGDLYLADANGGGVELLLASGEVGFSARNLAWSPDGAWLIVHEPIAPHAWPGELVLVRVADAYTERLGASEFSQATWGP